MHRAWVSGVENHHPRTMLLFPGTPITRPQSARTRRGELQLPCRVEHRSAQPCVTSRGDGAERSRENLAHRFSGGANLLKAVPGGLDGKKLGVKNKRLLAGWHDGYLLRVLGVTS